MTSSDRLEWLREAVEGALGPVEELEVPPGGDARMVRARVRLADGRTAFAKLALHPETAAALGREELVYRLGRPWHPGVVVAGDGPLLVVEDLAEARWPPPWPEDLEPLWVALAEVAEVSPPDGLDELEDPPDLWAAIGARPGGGSGGGGGRLDHPVRRGALGRRPPGDRR